MNQSREQDRGDSVCKTGTERREERKENRGERQVKRRVERRNDAHTDIKNKGKFP
jgi:hypothetical protein